MRYASSSAARVLAPLAAATLLVLAACGAESSAPSASALDSTSMLAQDTTLNAPLAEVLGRRERFRVFSTMLDSARLLRELRGGGPYTVFAPTDSGIQKLPEGLVEELLLPGNRERLRQIVGYHLHRGPVAPDSLPDLDAISTLTDSALPVAEGGGGRVLVGNERASEHAITASNGRIFALDAPVMPPPGASASSLPAGGPDDSLEAASQAPAGSNAGDNDGS